MNERKRVQLEGGGGRECRPRINQISGAPAPREVWRRRTPRRDEKTTAVAPRPRPPRARGARSPPLGRARREGCRSRRRRRAVV